MLRRSVILFLAKWPTPSSFMPLMTRMSQMWYAFVFLGSFMEHEIESHRRCDLPYLDLYWRPGKTYCEGLTSIDYRQRQLYLVKHYFILRIDLGSGYAAPSAPYDLVSSLLDPKHGVSNIRITSQNTHIALSWPHLVFYLRHLSFIFITCLHLAQSFASTALIPPSKSLTGDGDTATSGHDVGQVYWKKIIQVL